MFSEWWERELFIVASKKWTSGIVNDIYARKLWSILQSRHGTYARATWLIGDAGLTKHVNNQRNFDFSTDQTRLTHIGDK
jgi:hypothetical protein